MQKKMQKKMQNAKKDVYSTNHSAYFPTHVLSEDS